VQQRELMQLLVDAFDRVNTPYALVGSMASGVWGEPRMTLDINVVALFSGNVAAPEDIILGKLIYYRKGRSEKHLRDIRGIMVTSDEIIDRTYLEKWVAELGVSDAWGDAQAWIKRNE